MKSLRILGLAFLIYWVFLFAMHTSRGSPHIMLWTSHAVLLLAGVGLILEKNFLISAALILIAIPHCTWIMDALLKLAGLPSLGTTDYLWDNSLLSIFLSLHHFLVLPILFTVIWVQGQVHKHAWLLAGGYLASLSLLVLILTPYNINCAKMVCDMPFLSFINILNILPQFVYFIIMHALMLGIYWLSGKALIAILRLK